MSDSVIEIIKLDNGDIALCHSDAPEQPLVTISFSEQIQSVLQDAQMQIAQSMMQAGMDSFNDFQAEQYRAGEQALQEQAKILH